MLFFYRNRLFSLIYFGKEIEVDLSRELSSKLTRYFLNADPFLWGTLRAKNKKKRLLELRQMGFLANYLKSSNPVYAKINRDLLIELGIGGILEKIVIPRIESIFTRETLRYFRDCWEQGQTPDIDYLVQNQLYRKDQFFSLRHQKVYDGLQPSPVVGYKDPAFIFTMIHTRYNFVERWTVFAGLWFEEIEPLIR